MRDDVVPRCYSLAVVHPRADADDPVLSKVHAQDHVARADVDVLQLRQQVLTRPGHSLLVRARDDQDLGTGTHRASAQVERGCELGLGPLDLVEHSSRCLVVVHPRERLPLHRLAVDEREQPDSLAQHSCLGCVAPLAQRVEGGPVPSVEPGCHVFKRHGVSPTLADRCS